MMMMFHLSHLGCLYIRGPVYTKRSSTVHQHYLSHLFEA